MVEYGLEVFGLEDGTYLVGSSKNDAYISMKSIDQVVDYTKRLPPLDIVEEPVLVDISATDKTKIYDQRTKNILLNIVSGIQL
ncbi:hypothetical protein HON71_01725 [Candidatus Woesearchaeota archaeon]|jgi:hypothetical protein|nr:hypothetical protein [Candidatus Woesearchaeota archaeon]